MIKVSQLTPSQRKNWFGALYIAAYEELEAKLKGEPQNDKECTESARGRPIRDIARSS